MLLQLNSNGNISATRAICEYKFDARVESILQYTVQAIKKWRCRRTGNEARKVPHILLRTCNQESTAPRSLW